MVVSGGSVVTVVDVLVDVLVVVLVVDEVVLVVDVVVDVVLLVGAIVDVVVEVLVGVLVVGVLGEVEVDGTVPLVVICRLQPLHWARVSPAVSGVSLVA